MSAAGFQSWRNGDEARVYHRLAPVGARGVVIAAYEDRHNLAVVQVGALILAVDLSCLRRHAAAEVAA